MGRGGNGEEYGKVEREREKEELEEEEGNWRVNGERELYIEEN